MLEKYKKMICVWLCEFIERNGDMTTEKENQRVSLRLYLLLSLCLGWVFDALFWGKQAGISFPIFLSLCLLAGLLLSWRERKPLHRNALLLILPIGFFSVMVFFRSEPLTVFLNQLLTVAFIGLLVHSAVSGGWLRYGMLDYAVNIFLLLMDALVRPFLHSWSPPIDPAESVKKPGWRKRPEWRKIFPLVRGLLLALPFLLVFTCLLASADPVFAKTLQQMFTLDQIPEYIIRVLFIAFLTYAFVGIFLHAFQRKLDSQSLYADRQVVPSFLGPIEASIVFLSVIALFGFFLVIQFQYFFGGQTNIHLDGFTYAEYAVRGFWELIAVAVISLLMFLGLHAVTRRSGVWEGRTFSGLAVSLMLLVQVILYSAVARLNLYEEAYGFSRIRTYAHVFLVWVGILFLAVILLEVVRRTRFGALAVLLSVVGFAVSLNLLNVDDFIVRRNVLRAGQDADVDAAYLGSLSTDAIPAMNETFSGRSSTIQETMGVSLACHVFQNDHIDTSWQAFQWSREQARRIFGDISESLVPYALQVNDRGYPEVLFHSQTYSCLPDFQEMER